MSERNGGRFEGMVMAKLNAIDERVEEMLGAIRAIEERCRGDHAARAALTAEVRALRDRTDFHMRVIWSAVAWIVVAAAGVLFATLGVSR